MRARALLLSAACAFVLGSGLASAQEPPPRIVAVGDVHGSPGAFSRLLRAAGLVDEDGSWSGDEAILVQTGDLTDRGPGVRQVLDIMRRLERTAAAGGGRVESLLGNHEVYNLIGYWDYQSTPLPVFTAIASAFAGADSEKTRKKAYKEWARWARKYEPCVQDPSRKKWMERTPLGFVEYQEALSPRGEYGQWLRQKRVIARIGDSLFLHGGLSPELAERGVDSIESINAQAAAELEQFDRDRDWLETDGVIPRYATLSELHCAVAYELLWINRHFEPELESRRKALEEIKLRLPDPNTWLLLDPLGPVWFRGYARWSEQEAEQLLPKVLETFAAKRLVVGHTPQPGSVLPRFEGRIFLIDTAMAYPELEGRAVALEIRGEEIATITEAGRAPLADSGPYRELSSGEEASIPAADNQPAPESSGDRPPGTGTEPGSRDLAEGTAIGHESIDSRSAAATDRNREPPADEFGTAGDPQAPGSAPVAGRTWLGADGGTLPFADEEALLEFLQTAKIVDRETVGKGVSEAEKLLLEQDGVRAHALFHDIHEEKQRHRQSKKTFFNFRDSYLNNLAAYELGRLMELPNLVPTARREIRGKPGSIQLWIEKAIDEEERRKQGGAEALSVYLRRRIADMWVFDNLIHNADRNQGNMLHDSRGEFWMIDHTRSFNGSRNLVRPAQMRRCSKELLAAIRNLDEASVRRRLDPYLRTFEIKALLARREKLLQYLDARVAEFGETRVLFTYADADDAVTVYYDEEAVPASPRDG